jgi:Zn-dependent peptidase ImmA (M78 family)
MNTVVKGDKFEQNAYNLIQNAINDDVLGISPKHSKVFRKKGYYSHLRKKEIIFDLSIEIWPPKAERFSFLFLIECKDYSTKKVPVDDVEEFLYKLSQIANLGYFIKGVFISNNSFQEGALEIANNSRLMLIEVNSENELEVKLHKIERNLSSEISNSEKEIQTFLYNVFKLDRVDGLKKYSRSDIENISNSLLEQIDKNILKSALKIPIDKITQFLNLEYNLGFDFNNLIEVDKEKSILGYFDVNKNLIKIDKSLHGTNRFAFLLAHEIGHFILHRGLKINQQVYNKFKDSEYDFILDKYLLNNYKNWIEWQANEFASNLIMPNDTFCRKLVQVQEKLGISKRGYIYLDDQPINKRDFIDITSYLCEFFNTTFTSVKYKLESLDLIKYDQKKDMYRDELRNMYFE